MTALPTISRFKCLKQSLKKGNTPLTLLNKLIDQNGPTLKVYTGGIYPMILTADPDFIQHILQKNARKYLKSNKHFESIKQFWGNGLLTSEGPYWLKQRRSIQPGFHKNRLKGIMKLMDRIAENYFQRLDERIGQNPDIDIFDEMKELTGRIIANAIFSKNLREKEFQKIKVILPRLQDFIVKMVRRPYSRWWYQLSGQVKKHEQLRDKGNSIIQSYIYNRRKTKEECDDLLQMLLDVRYEDSGEGMSDTQLIEEINLLFIAGHDTSTNALSWAWYLLCKHPEVLEKLKEEIHRVLPDDEITFERLMQLEYTQQVIEEAIRIFPPVWVTNRIAVEDDEFKGIPIKKGTTMATYFYGLYHSPKVWDNPESFQPERFVKDKKKARHKFSFLPFGGGPRMCIGKQFATIEMKLVLAKMVKRYQLDLVPGQNIEPNPMINLHPKNGIKMKVGKRS